MKNRRISFTEEEYAIVIRALKHFQDNRENLICPAYRNVDQVGYLAACEEAVLTSKLLNRLKP